MHSWEDKFRNYPRENALFVLRDEELSNRNGLIDWSRLVSFTIFSPDSLGVPMSMIYTKL